MSQKVGIAVIVLAGSIFSVAHFRQMGMASSAFASDAASPAPSYSPPVRYAEEDTNLYWGDTHLSTSINPMN